MVPLSRASGDPDSAIATIHDFDDLASPDEIRILRLSSGQPQDPLHGVLEKYRLREFSGYETLSYTWACYDDGNNQHLTDHSKSRVIYLGDYWDAFPITENCDHALRRLRDPDRPRLIWVDAICINQKNKIERGHQVDMMHRIYGNAHAVAVYLGTASADSDLAMQLLRHPDRLSDLSKVTSRELSSLASLFQRPYFTRTWVVQEVALARSLRLYCGNEEVFVPAYSPEAPFWELIPPEIIPAWLKYARRWNHARGHRFLSLIQDTRACQCSDPRDRVFALFGLAPDPELVADYHLSADQVYTKVASYILKVDLWRALSVLDLATNSAPSGVRPSWVPDWSQNDIFDLTARLTQHRTYASPDQRVRAFLVALDAEYPGFWGSEGAANETAENKDIAYVIFDQRLTNRWASNAHWLDPRVSDIGRLTIRGIPLRFASHPAILKEHILVFHNRARTALLLFEFRRRWPQLSSTSHPLVLWLPGNEVAVLVPVEGSPEFRLVGVSKAEIYHIDNGGEPRQLPESVKSFVVEPYSVEEQTILNGALSQPSLFPRLGQSNRFWKVSPEDWLRDGVSVELLLSDLCTEYHVTEMQLWGQWKTLQSKGQAMLWNRAFIVSILNQLHHQESSQHGTSPRYNSQSVTGEQERDGQNGTCFIANFLSLFITNPSSKGFVEDSPRDALEDPSDPNEEPLDFLRHWAAVTLRLISHLAMAETYPFIEQCSFPGLDLVSRAEEVWRSHMTVAERAIRREQASDSDVAGCSGGSTEFTMRRIAWQRFGAFDGVADEDIGVALEGDSTVEKYWDWAEMDRIKETRQEHWTALNQLRSQLREECSGMSNLHIDLTRMREKIGTRLVLEDMGLQVDGLVDEMVTIQ